MSESTPCRERLRVLMVLPPDFDAPEGHRRHRFPHQGPALVAAAVRADGVEMRVVDLELEVHRRATAIAPRVLDDDERLDRHLGGGRDDELCALADELIDRLEDVDVDAFAISVDRHTQIEVSLLLGVALKRRFGLPVILGGGNGRACLERLLGCGGKGIDLITGASTPSEIRFVFREIRDVAGGRWESPVEPLPAPMATAPDDWPTPDFGIYDLVRYRRDPFLADGARAFPRYDGSVGPRLFLPYHFSFDCQYACSFCQRGGKQTVKSMDRVVRDLASLAEAYECRDFMLFDTQINLHAEAFSRALIEAGLGIHWTDSYRVAPRRPADALELMARAGCVGLTFGVESASDRMLKKMVKGHSRAKATAVVRDAHALEMFVRVNLLPCFPGETRADHELTVAWVRENAFAMDDIAPSSFYLAEGSPVGQDPRRFGIVIREARTLQGDHKFRKNLGSLAYDEIGGYTWEEREATLRPAEEELVQAWREGRGSAGYGIAQPSQSFALRRDFATKAEAYAKVASWAPGGGMTAGVTARVGRVLPGASGVGDLAPDGELAEEARAEIPAGSVRALAVARVRQLLARHGFEVPEPAAEAARLAIDIRDPKGRGVRVVVERLRPDARFLRRGRRLMVWYQAVDQEPTWTGIVVPRVAELLCSPPFDGIADELRRSLVTATAEPATPRRFSVIDLVRTGLKPAASLVVGAEAALREFEDLPGRAVSRFGFVKDERENLVRLADPAPGEGLRMLYVGRAQADVERLRDIEERLYPRNEGVRPLAAERAALHEELGTILGFPPCCARAFAEAQEDRRGRADLYAAMDRPGWDLVPIDWRCNHVAAHQYELPFLIHVPCRPSCAATRDLVEATVARLYPDGSRAAIEAILAQGAVVWPDDRIVFFRPRGRPDGEGVIAVEAWNDEAHVAARGRPRSADRSLPRDAGGFPDAAVDALRKHEGRLHVRVEGRWRIYAPAQASSLAPPLVVVPVR